MRRSHHRRLQTDPISRATISPRSKRTTGRVHCADWADGWRGFAGGAAEQGARAAQKVTDALAVD
jgi:monoamine oxidase